MKTPYLENSLLFMEGRVADLLKKILKIRAQVFLSLLSDIWPSLRGTRVIFSYLEFVKIELLENETLI